MTVCWAKELLAGLMFVDPSKDWLTHIIYPHAAVIASRTREGWPGWLSRSLLIATRSLTVTPQILSARTASAAPTATSCTVLMTVGCWCPRHTSVLTCRLLKRKPSPQCAWLLPQLSAMPSTASLTHNASANGVGLE
jgi:hypothetical protein